MLSSMLAAIPQPPVTEAMPKTAETIFNVFIFIPLGIALAIAVRQILGGRGPLLLFCVIGGGFAAFFEPIVDVLGMCYLKEVDALGTFTALDRTMPLYICFVYPWYVGGLGYLAYKLFERGVTVRAMFALWALDALVDVALETPGILAGTYLYYGHQPLNPWGFPLWWAFVNPLMPMITGALIYLVRPHLKTAWQLLVVVPLIPMGDGLANAASGWPMWIALNQDDVSYVWTHLAALATLGLSLLTVWLISLVVARPATELADETLMQKLKALLFGGPEPIPARATRTPDLVGVS